MIRLKELREEKNLTQKALSLEFNVAQNTISNWENGTREPDIETINQLAKYFNVSNDYFLGKSNIRKQPIKGVKIPVLGRVQAGVPIEAITEIIDYEEIEPELAATGEFFCLQIKGDSMEPRFVAGDVVVVRRQPDIETGDIAVIMVNGQDATVKRVKKANDGLILIPNNTSYEPMFYSNEDIMKLPVEILGKVIELRGKFI